MSQHYITNTVCMVNIITITIWIFVHIQLLVWKENRSMQGSYSLLQDGGQGGPVAQRQFSKAVLEMKVTYLLHASRKSLGNNIISINIHGKSFSFTKTFASFWQTRTVRPVAKHRLKCIHLTILLPVTPRVWPHWSEKASKNNRVFFISAITKHVTLTILVDFVSYTINNWFVELHLGTSASKTYGTRI